MFSYRATIYGRILVPGLVGVAKHPPVQRQPLRQRIIWQIEKPCSKVWCQRRRSHSLPLPLGVLPWASAGSFYWVGKINSRSGVSN